MRLPIDEIKSKRISYMDYRGFSTEMHGEYRFLHFFETNDLYNRLYNQYVQPTIEYIQAIDKTLSSEIIFNYFKIEDGILKIVYQNPNEVFDELETCREHSQQIIENMIEVKSEWVSH